MILPNEPMVHQCAPFIREIIILVVSREISRCARDDTIGGGGTGEERKHPFVATLAEGAVSPNTLKKRWTFPKAEMSDNALLACNIYCVQCLYRGIHSSEVKYPEVNSPISLIAPSCLPSCLPRAARASECRERRAH